MMSRAGPGSPYDRVMRIIGLLLCAFLMSCSSDGSGDEFCDGDNCICPADTDCTIDCITGGSCDVQAQPGSAVDVDCGDALTCDVECMTADSCDVACNGGDCDVTCPADGCTVTGCDEELCDVTCGALDLPTRVGDTATCP
jgi:hypothetical protein